MRAIFRHRSQWRQRKQEGMILILTLCLIVLISITTIAFLIRATANSTIESSRASQVVAQQVVETSADYVTGKFLQEMTNNAVTTTANNITIFSITNAPGIMPQRLIASAISTSDTNYYNLIRQSVSGADANASTHSTSDISQNGRIIGTNVWNAPALLSGSGFSANNQVPNWIYLYKDGSMNSTPSSKVIGRFAYNAYDIGGLLDANVAGYPPSLATSANLPTLKASEAGADLSVVPGLTSVAQFVTWRNASTASTMASYITAVGVSATNGFLYPQSGDHNITSRQDLIKLASSNNYGMTTNALPFLTHFSRSLNAPSCQPTSNGTGAAYQYKTNADLSTSTNRNIANVRVTTAFIRRDGTSAKVGDPLVNSKFALSRLLGLGLSGPAAPATTATIQRDFGLVWQNSRWEYCGPSGTTIQTSIPIIGSIGNRDANFFELLKAGILSGSLGQGPADNNGTIGMGLYPAYSTASSNSALAGRLCDYQIIQIGANLIDQYDTDSIPTQIAFDTFSFFGIENLPYVNRLYTRVFRPSAGIMPGGVTQPAYRPYMRGWLALEMWNPNSNAASGPSKSMRVIQTAGHMRIFTNQRTNASGLSINSSSPYYHGGLNALSIPQTYSTQGQIISFTAGSVFSNPSVLTSSVGSAANSQAEGNLSDSGLSWSGFWLGDINEPDSTIPGTLGALAPLTANDMTAKLNYGFGPFFTTDVVLELQIDAGGGNWRPVQRLYYPNAQSSYSSFYYANWEGIDLTATTSNNVTIGSHGLAFSDPRTERFGMGLLNRNYSTLSSSTPWDNKALRQGINPDSNGQFVRDSGCLPYIAPGSGTWNEPAYLIASLCENISTATTYVRDVDGFLRAGDGYLATSAGFDALNSSTTARPIILDRPFLNIGEMGYAFRDQPWKTMDFSSASSADSALLDLFCLNDSVPMTAGKINLNSAPPVVLQAILSGADRDLTPGASTFTSTQASTLANSLRAQFVAMPLLSVGDMVPASAAITATDFGGSSEGSIKTRREAAARAISQVGQTRTWNLLFDIVAQAGRFAPSGTSSSDFIVEGETRIWQSTALDRFTGQVIDKQTEQISQ